MFYWCRHTNLISISALLVLTDLLKHSKMYSWTLLLLSLCPISFSYSWTFTLVKRLPLKSWVQKFLHITYSFLRLQFFFTTTDRCSWTQPRRIPEMAKDSKSTEPFWPRFHAYLQPHSWGLAPIFPRSVSKVLSRLCCFNGWELGPFWSPEPESALFLAAFFLIRHFWLWPLTSC